MIAERPLSQKNGSRKALTDQSVCPNQITDHAFYHKNTETAPSGKASPEVTPPFQLSSKTASLMANNTLHTLPSQRFQVFSPSFQSSFHLSFTVLVCYRFPINIQSQEKSTSHLRLYSRTTRLNNFKIGQRIEERDYYPLWCLVPKDLFQRLAFSDSFRLQFPKDLKLD